MEQTKITIRDLEYAASDMYEKRMEDVLREFSIVCEKDLSNIAYSEWIKTILRLPLPEVEDERKWDVLIDVFRLAAGSSHAASVEHMYRVGKDCLDINQKAISVANGAKWNELEDKLYHEMGECPERTVLRGMYEGIDEHYIPHG